MLRRVAWSSSRSGDVFFLVADDAFADDGFLKFCKQFVVANDQPRLDERRFGLHVRVGHLHAVVKVAHGIADFQADVPERIQACRQSAWPDTAAACRPATWPSCRNMKSMSLCGFNSARPKPPMATSATAGNSFWPARTDWLWPIPRDAATTHPEWPRAPGRFLVPSAPARCRQLQAVRLDLEKIFVAREFFRRGGVGRKGQPRLGGGFDFFEQILHGRIGWRAGGVKEIKNLGPARLRM